MRLMFFRKKAPQRLYYPTKAKWYSRPRRKPAVSARPGASSLAQLRKRAQTFLKRPFYIALAAAGVVGCLLLFLFSAYFSVAEIHIVREDPTVDSERVAERLNPYLGRNLIFFPQRKMQAALNEAFPEFSSIRLSRKLPRTLEVRLESHPLVANLKAYYTLPLPELDI